MYMMKLIQRIPCWSLNTYKKEGNIQMYLHMKKAKGKMKMDEMEHILGYSCFLHRINVESNFKVFK